MAESGHIGEPCAFDGSITLTVIKKRCAHGVWSMICDIPKRAIFSRASMGWMARIRMDLAIQNHMEPRPLERTPPRVEYLHAFRQAP